MNYQQLCSEIVDEAKRLGIVIRNKRTGAEVKTWEDVWNFDSHGELGHLWEWFAMLFPDRIDEHGNILDKPDAR